MSLRKILATFGLAVGTAALSAGCATPQPDARVEALKTKTDPDTGCKVAIGAEGHSIPCSVPEFPPLIKK